MPELPDVETFRRYLESRALGKVVTRAEVSAPAMVRNGSPRRLRSRLGGARFRATHRHGKYLFLECDRGGWLLLHFGMTGYPRMGRRVASRDPARFRVRFDDGTTLTFHDVRKLGTIGWVEDVQSFIRARRLGPDALDMPWETFRARLGRAKGTVKTALMNQRAVAGIGNVYADEILFRAGLHPAAKAPLPDSTWRRLHRALRTVLARAIAAGADPSRVPRTFLLPNRRTHGRCPRCGRPLSTLRLGGRTAYYCERDQPPRRREAHGGVSQTACGTRP